VRYASGKLTVDAQQLSKEVNRGVSGALGEGGGALRSAQGSAQRALAGVRARLGLSCPPSRMRSRTSLGPPGGRAVVVVGADGATRTVVLAARPARSAAPAPLAGFLLLLAAAAALFMVLRPRSAGGEGGRWVRDRSLGGRMVRVKAGAAESRGAAGPTVRWRRSGEAVGPSPLEAEGAEGEASRARRPSAQQAVALPAWWCEPAPVYGVGEARRATMLGEARAALSRLNDARVGGGSYDPADFLQLRAAASAAGATVEVTAGESVRDALYRGAAELALREVGGRGSLLQGEAPGPLLSGLALDMRLPPTRAAQIVTTCSAASLNSALLDSLALLRRAGGPQSLEMQERMLRLGAQLRALPLPATAAEVELLAAGLGLRSRPAERQQLLALFRAANGEGEATATVQAALSSS